MKTIIILLITLFSLHAELLEMPLSRFAGLVASKHKINIIVNKDIDSENEIFYIEAKNENVFLMHPFRLLLKKKGYELKFSSKGSFYYIDKIADEELKPHFLKLDAPVYDDLVKTLDMLEVRHSYIENTHTLTYLSNNALHEQLKDLVFKNDDAPEQFRIKISILETNMNELKERGADLQAYTSDLTGNTQSFIQLITMPASSTVNTFPSENGFTAVLKFLNTEGYTKILSSPHFTVQSNKEIYFSAVDNIPYQTSSSSVNGASQSNTETITYQDVGLKINLLPKVVLGTIYIDLNLVVENILDKGSLTPSISKRELKNSFQLKKGNVLVLSGINQTETYESEHGVPLLMDIPLLGYFFSYSSVEEIERNLTITIEVI